MTFDPTIKASDLLTLVGFIVGSLWFVWTMRGELRMLAKTVENQGDEIKDLKKVVTAQALQTQRLDFLDQQLQDLRNGIGFKPKREGSMLFDDR